MPHIPLMISRYNACIDRLFCLRDVLIRHYDLAMHQDLAHRPDTRGLMKKLLNVFNLICCQLSKSRPDVHVEYRLFQKRLQILNDKIDLIHYQLNGAIEAEFFN